METITFHCKVITPMFLAGADGQTPELRAPSIKGAMRFWWRACNGHLGVEDLREKEESIFGGTSNGGKRSKVTIRLVDASLEKAVLPNPRKDNNQQNNPGIYYLWYTMPMNQKGSFWKGLFKIRLSSFDRKCLIDAAYAFWTLSAFGGIGSRARRAAGNFQIIDFNSSTEDWSLPIGDSVSNELSNVLQIVKQRFDIPNTKYNPQANSSFPAFNNCQIFVLAENFSEALHAVEHIGQKFQDFRAMRQPDYGEVKDFIVKGKTPNQIERAEFGLPLGFQFRSLNKPNNNAQIKTTDRTINRSASSLFFSIREREGRFYIVLTNFASILLPDDVKLKITKKGNRKIVNQGYEGIKERFLSSLNKTQV